MLNTDKDAPLVHSSGHGENAEMFSTDQHMDSSDDDDDHYNIVNTGEKIPIKYIVKMCH
jgi:hypothetical protein